MDRQKYYHRLILITAFFTAASMFSDVFVNIFLWRLKGNFILIAVYQIATYAVIPFIFYASGYICMRLDRVKIYQIGIWFFISFYLLVILLNEDVTRHLLLIGAVKGFAMGFYWFGFHVLTYDYTTTENRDKFYGRMGMIAGASSLVAPFISGLVVEKLPGFKGYYIIFGLSLLLFACAVFLSRPLKSTPIRKPYKIEDLVFSKNREWMKTMLAFFFLAAKDSIAMFLTAILIVRETGSEFTFGKFALLTSTVTIATSNLIGRFSKPGNRQQYVLAGSILFLAAAVLLVYKINFHFLLIYGILVAVGDHLVKIPLNAHSLDIISMDAAANERKMEYIVARDVPIALGRITTLVVFVYLLQNWPAGAIKAIILIISAFPLAVWWAIRKG